MELLGELKTALCAEIYIDQGDIRPQFLVVSQRLGAGRRDTDDRDALTLKQSLRTLAGIGLAAELTLVDTYLSELLPRRSRGRYVARIERRTLLIVSTLAVAVFGVAFGLATNITLVIAAGVMTTISTVVQSNFTQTYKRSCSPPPTAAPPSACRMQPPAWSAPCCRWAP